MSLDLQLVRKLATDVTRQEHPEVTVLGVTTAEGSRNHAEVVMARAPGGADSRFVVLVNREGDESTTRAEMRRQFRDELRQS